MTWHAILMPESSGFKTLEDRMLFTDNGCALVFQTKEDAENWQSASPYAALYREAVIAPLVPITAAESPSEPPSTRREMVSYDDALTVGISRGDDGNFIIEVEGPEQSGAGTRAEDTLPNGQPNIRIWLNKALIYSAGEVGKDLNNFRSR